MEFLLEINTEEMPSSHVKMGLAQLEEKFGAELGSAGIGVNRIKTCGTCRRMVVSGDFAAGQKDKEDIIIGPPRSVALAPDGSSAAPALGFARAQGVDVRDLIPVKTERGEYLGVKKTVKGKSTRDILVRVVPQIIASLSFPKMMRWGEGAFRFSRPIKNMLCFFDGELLPFVFEGISSGEVTSGHKILSPVEIRAKTFKEYRNLLEKNKVIVDQEERRKSILWQVDKKLSSIGAELHLDEELLEKLVFDVEHPYVFMGSFPAEYLDLPLEILSTVMREGQRLFSVVKQKNQLPYFLGVADAVSDSRSLIRKGNERVLKARLEDARFFWTQDLKVTLKERAPGLKKVVFQEKIGTYEEKTQRLKKIVVFLCDKLDAGKVKKQAVLAAELCKVDLLTEMVREFPSLQGKVGGLYAKEESYPLEVSQAVYEHYQPVGIEDESPSTLTGAILSVSDKMDSIVGAAGSGIQVTGSSDPYGLRRNAQGICKIILDKRLKFSFSRFIDKTISVYEGKLEKGKEEIKAYCLDFFAGRLRYLYERLGFRYDLVNAALGAGLDNIYHSFLRLKALNALKSSPQFEPLILIAKRVNNILEGKIYRKVSSELLREKEERELYSTFSIIRENVLPLFNKGEFLQAQKIIFRIQSPLNGFFDHVLVMTEEKKLRENRLALLQAISRLLIQVADFSQIVVEGERKSAVQGSPG